MQNTLTNEPVLVIDTREKSTTLLDTIITRCEEEKIEYLHEGLSVGDFAWKFGAGFSIGIEHKEASDFVGSVISHNIFSQVADMQQYPSAYLFIEGKIAFGFDRKYGRFSQTQYIGAIAWVQERTSVKVYHWDNQSQFVEALFALPKQNNREERVHGLTRTKKKTHKDNPSLSMLYAVPGVSHKTAQEIYAEYPSFGQFVKDVNAGCCKVKLRKNVKEFIEQLF